MGAGASAPKKGSRRANDMVNQLDEEIAICDDAARDSLEMLQEESNEGKQTSPFNKNKAKRRPMPIPLHVFQTDADSSSNAKPSIPKTPRSPHASAGHDTFKKLLSLDDSEIAAYKQSSSPRSSDASTSSSNASTSSSPKSSPLRRRGSGSVAAAVAKRSAAKRGARLGKKMSKGNRHNSTSSWYSVKTTMGSAPKDATIRCISTVILRHMSAHKRNSKRSKNMKWNVFNDSPEVWLDEKGSQEDNDHDSSNNKSTASSSTRQRTSSNGSPTDDDGRSVFRSQRTPRARSGTNSTSFDDTDGDANDNVLPSVSRIREFIEYVFTKAQLEIDGLIIAFIYLERLLETASRDGVNLLYSKNWRTICFICLVLASKIWDDFSMDNSDFAVVWKPTTLKRVNQLERKVLELLRYNVSIPASDYAACYFKLRSLVTSLGLKEDELQMVTGALRPLSSNEAYKLEALSESYQRQVGTSIQRQQTSGLSTPLLSADRRRVSNEGDGSNEGTKEGESPKINVRRAKSGRRLVNQDKSKSFTVGGISDRDQNRARRAAPASVEHLMYAASSKTGESNNESGGSSRQPWKINRSEGESGGGGKTGR